MDDFQRGDVTTADAGAAAETLCGTARRAQVQAPEVGAFELTLSWTMAGPVSVLRAQLSAPSWLRVGIEPPETLGIAHITGGRLRVEAGRDRFRITGQPRLLPERRIVSTMEGTDLSMLTVESAWLQDHAAELLQRENFRLHFSGTTPYNEAAADFWTATARHFQEEVLDNREAMSHPLIRAEAYRKIATALLWTFPSTFHDHDPPGADTSSLPGPVHRAVAFIDEHLAQPLGLAEIAAAARLSPHSLVLAFRQRLGTTPGAYLRTARLDAAHHDLLDADPAHGATVATIAHRWGFTNLARFTTAYRTHYRCSPTTTLHS